MYIEYKDAGLKELFEDLNDVQNSQNLMEAKFGIKLTRAIKKRFNQLRALSCFSELKRSGIGEMEILQDEFAGLFALQLTQNYLLLVRPKGSIKVTEDCRTVIIEGILDYNAKSKII